MITKELLDKYIKFTHKWEGGLSRDKNDSASSFTCPTPYKGVNGYHTNMGVTYKVWRSMFGSKNDQRFLEMNNEDWFNVFKTLYWNGVRGDEYTHPSIAIYVTGIAWGSGRKRAGLTLQTAIKKCGKSISVDGVIGNTTIRLANECDARQLFDELLKERERFFRAIAKDGTENAKFLKGWLNRLEDYRKVFRP